MMCIHLSNVHYYYFLTLKIFVFVICTIILLLFNVEDLCFCDMYYNMIISIQFTFLLIVKVLSLKVVSNMDNRSLW
jgi:hypothetical protein